MRRTNGKQSATCLADKPKGRTEGLCLLGAFCC